jgi:hypothetical protein
MALCTDQKKQTDALPQADVPQDSYQWSDRAASIQRHHMQLHFSTMNEGPWFGPTNKVAAAFIQAIYAHSPGCSWYLYTS